MSTWKQLLEDCAKGDKIIACTLTDDELNTEFDDGYGGIEGEPFTAWGEKYVYFPATYDGSEWVGRVPRNPCNDKTVHIGG